MNWSPLVGGSTDREPERIGMKTLKAAIQAGKLLVLDIEFADGDKQTRCPAAIGWCGRSLLWADAGWPTTPGHAFHRFMGKLIGQGPWTLIPADASFVARIVVRELERGEPATAEYELWRAFRATPEGRQYTNAAAMKAAADLPLAG